MVDDHVDSLSLFQDRMSTTELGGNLSVRLKEGEQPILLFGHDECIYKQYLLTKRAWTLPSGGKKNGSKRLGSGSYDKHPSITRVWIWHAYHRRANDESE